MNLDLFSKRAAGATELFLRKHGPGILMAAGVTGFIATTYLTGKAVLKSQEKVKSFKLKHQEIMSKEETEEYTRQQKGREAGELWVRDGMGILRDFSPAIVTGSVSIVCVLASHGLMRNKQAALLAAYGALDAGFKAYRQRVRDEFGEEKELEIYRRVKMVEKEGEEGEVLPCEIDYSDKMPSPYAKFFDEYSKNWSKTPEYNLQFLRGQENYANDRLRSHGFVFLNEVYESLGLPRTQIGQIVGWKLNGDGDGFISFGLYDIYDESSRAFINGTEGTVLLDFNVDGPITI